MVWRQTPVWSLQSSLLMRVRWCLGVPKVWPCFFNAWTLLLWLLVSIQNLDKVELLLEGAALLVDLTVVACWLDPLLWWPGPSTCSHFPSRAPGYPQYPTDSRCPVFEALAVLRFVCSAQPALHERPHSPNPRVVLGFRVKGL